MTFLCLRTRDGALILDERNHIESILLGIVCAHPFLGDNEVGLGEEARTDSRNVKNWQVCRERQISQHMARESAKVPAVDPLIKRSCPL